VIESSCQVQMHSWLQECSYYFLYPCSVEWKDVDDEWKDADDEDVASFKIFHETEESGGNLQTGQSLSRSRSPNRTVVVPVEILKHESRSGRDPQTRHSLSRSRSPNRRTLVIPVEIPNRTVVVLVENQWGDIQNIRNKAFNEWKNYMNVWPTTL
jgi:hypothetical protein